MLDCVTILLGFDWLRFASLAFRHFVLDLLPVRFAFVPFDPVPLRSAPFGVVPFRFVPFGVILVRFVLVFPSASVDQGKNRMFEIQVQGRFKRPPEGDLYISLEITDRMKLGLLAKVYRDRFVSSVFVGFVAFWLVRPSLGRFC